MSWLDVRESEKWALVSGTCLASDIHGWVAHQVLLRNQERGFMKSNSFDGEFMRLLSGTHHVAASFKRAGLRKGDDTAWIVDLSCDDNDDMYVEHARKMNFKILDNRPSLEIFDAQRIGIERGIDENAAIAHIHLSDLR
tara:strand:- start:42 stop:458 length:417 start_codon:yes stop_codon:yes gene_type:complete